MEYDDKFKRAEKEKDIIAKKIIDKENFRKKQIEDENYQIEQKNRTAYERAQKESGTWVYGTIFKIKPSTGEKIYLYENEALFKLD